MRLFLTAFLLLGLSFAQADTCAPPSNIAVVSEDGNIAVRIQVRRSSRSDPKSSERFATITKWNEEAKGYQFLRRVVLLNPQGPATAVITNDARFLVTFDEVCQIGRTSHAVVIYDLEKGTTSAHGLEDFLPKEYRETLTDSISNTFWRGDPHVVEGRQKVYVPAPWGSKTPQARVVIELATNAISFEPGDK